MAPQECLPLVTSGMQDELKRRAYALYERCGTVNAEPERNSLNAELARALNAAAELERYARGRVGDVDTVRAARVYLRALSAYIAFSQKLSD